VFSGCQDKTDLTAPILNPKSGNADLTRFVTIGNSLTAGYQSGSLYQSAQIYAFGNQIAQQVGTTFEEPLISDPGTAGRLEIKSFNLATNQIDIYANPKQGSPINISYSKPYNNLGIPGALLYDVLNATSSTTCASALFANKPNPLFDLILRGHGSQFAQAKALHPTFVTLWIGNNDVLGFATSGGASPAAPTDPNTFAFLYSNLVDSLSTLGAQVVVANIPDVTSIPFFTTVGPLIAQKLANAGIQGIFYQNHGGLSTSVATVINLVSYDVLVTLPGMTYAALIGHPTGQFYRDYGYPALPRGIDTTQPFGLSPANPWPDALILDASEISTAKTTTASYNSTISSLAASKGFGLFDVNSFFNQVASSGYSTNGLKFNAEFLLGGLFGLDGVHPTDQGQAILANEFIKVINSKFGASIPLINVAAVPSSIVLAKRSLLSSLGIPYFQPGSFDHLLY
jgi:hypothetical protein